MTIWSWMLVVFATPIILPYDRPLFPTHSARKSPYTMRQVSRNETVHLDEQVPLYIMEKLFTRGRYNRRSATMHVACIECSVYILSRRAHALRAPYLRRAHGWVRLARMIVVASGFGTITVFAFIYPLTDPSTTDGKCRIGFPLKVTIPLLWSLHLPSSASLKL